MSDQANDQVENVETGLAKIERSDPGQQLEVTNLDPKRGPMTFWASIVPQTARDRALIYNALTGQVKPLSKIMGETILLENVVIKAVSVTSPVTGEVKQAPRITLIDSDGKCYGCVSGQIFKDLQVMMGAFGDPPFNPPIPIRPYEGHAKLGRFFGLEIVAESVAEPEVTDSVT